MPYGKEIFTGMTQGTALYQESKASIVSISDRPDGPDHVYGKPHPTSNRPRCPGSPTTLPLVAQRIFSYFTCNDIFPFLDTHDGAFGTHHWRLQFAVVYTNSVPSSLPRAPSPSFFRVVTKTVQCRRNLFYVEPEESFASLKT
jgi:hypothetical protein